MTLSSNVAPYGPGTDSGNTYAVAQNPRGVNDSRRRRDSSALPREQYGTDDILIYGIIVLPNKKEIVAR